MGEPTNYKVFLELQRRSDTGTGTVNRIALNALSVAITVSKTVPNIPVPMAGAVTGESVNLAFDMGLASKTISISGILLEQSISKSKTTDADAVTATFTPFELAQLIHAYVDSSSFQDDQNINKLIILIPSKVGNDFTARGSQIDIPFTFKNREYDNDFTAFTDSPVEAFEEGNSIGDRTFEGITGFVRSFSTTFASEQPNNVEFTLEFEEAKVIADNFFD